MAWKFRTINVLNNSHCDCGPQLLLHSWRPCWHQGFQTRWHSCPLTPLKAYPTAVNYTPSISWTTTPADFPVATPVIWCGIHMYPYFVLQLQQKNSSLPESTLILGTPEVTLASKAPEVTQAQNPSRDSLLLLKTRWSPEAQSIQVRRQEKK